MDVWPGVRRCVAQACFLFERLEAPCRPAPAAPDEARVAAHLETWAHALGASDSSSPTMARYLAWHGLSRAAARQALSQVEWPESAALPAWAEVLGEALSLADPSVSDAPEANAAGEPIPFEDLLIPFVRAGQRRISARAGYAQLGPAAQASLERGLLSLLAEYAAPAFYVAFQAMRAQGLSPLAGLINRGQGDSLYRPFVRSMLDGGLWPFFQTYAVLARLLAMLTELWAEAQGRFLDHLALDLPRLINGLGDGAPPGLVTQLQLALSDRHCGGRSVIGLRFESGLQLIYKPKNLGMETAYNHLLAWLNARGAPLDMKVLKVLGSADGDHGWVGYAEAQACQSAHELTRYYQRAGALLALVYALEGSDCHSDNLVAHGQYPILVDAETLLHHRVQDLPSEDDHADASFQAQQAMQHSVLRSGLLPAWGFGHDQALAFDISGLGGYAGQTLPYRKPVWRDVNTDRMAFSLKRLQLPPRGNIPHLDGAPARLEDHAAGLVEGFQAMYRFLAAQCPALLAAEGPLDAFKDQQARSVLRATRVYALLLKTLRQPAYLRDGLDYSLGLEKLARVYLLYKDKPVSWPALDAERRGLYRLDVPFFTAAVGSETLILESGQSIPHYFSRPSFESMRERLAAMGEPDLVFQTDLTRAALHARLSDDAPLPGPAVQAFGGDDDVPTGPQTQADEVETGGDFAGQALQAARAIAGELARRAIRGRDGSLTWIAPQYMAAAGRFQLWQLGLDLYAGLSGVALFLAALNKVAGNAPGTSAPEAGALTSVRELCLAACRPVRGALRAGSSPDLAWMGIGGAAGLGSLLYSLVCIGQLLDEPGCLEEARAAVGLVTPERIAADSTLDVIGGAAGAILGLLAVHQVSGDAASLARAVACGQRLLEMRQTGADGRRTWPTLAGRRLTGFSHGAAGIAYVLLRLYQASGEASFQAAAAEAVAYEDSLRVEAAGNWPDLRAGEEAAGELPGQLRFMTAWCHGAPGIGLARLGGLASLDTPAIRQDIELALATTQRALADDSERVDHLCCGRAGLVEVLFTAGLQLKRLEWVAAAHSAAARLANQAISATGYRLSAVLPRATYSPGFFQGTAGIGYTLLRLAYPQTLPCVLLWETPLKRLYDGIPRNVALQALPWNTPGGGLFATN